jgi:Trk K+ transport system NAD-binding subunit
MTIATSTASSVRYPRILRPNTPSASRRRVASEGPEAASTALPLREEILTAFIQESSPACGRKLSELAFPEGAAATMVVRGLQLIAPKGGTELQAGDYISVFCRPEDRQRMHRLLDATESVPPARAEA